MRLAYTILPGGQVVLVRGLHQITMSPDEVRDLLNYLKGQYRALRPGKDWTKCPYEKHADDCDCGGRGGDR